MPSLKLLGPPITGGISLLSPNGDYLAHTLGGTKLVVRRARSPTEVVNVFQAIDKIEKIEFSPDSKYILSALYARNAVQVFCVLDPDWKCRINEGVAGLVSAAWMPDSAAILTESDFGIHCSVWSLTDNTQCVISLPKPATKGFKNQFFAFSEDARFLAVVHRIEQQDRIGLYSTGPVKELNVFAARSKDVAMVRFVPRSTHIVTADSPLSYKVCVYMPSGEALTVFEAYQNALGVRTLSIFNQNVLPDLTVSSESLQKESFPFTPSASSQSRSATEYSSPSLLAVGSYDGKVRLLTLFTWQCVATLSLAHPRDMEVGLVPEDFRMTVELSARELSQAHADALHASRENALSGDFESSKSDFAGLGLTGEDYAFVHRGLKTLPATPPPPSGAVNVLNSTGVRACIFSPSGAFLACAEDSFSRCVWIFRTDSLTLCSLIVFLQPMSAFAWMEKVEEDIEQLVFVCGSVESSAYVWTERDSVRKCSLSGREKQAQAEMRTTWSSVSVSSDGESILLKGRDNCCIAQIEAK